MTKKQANRAVALGAALLIGGLTPGWAADPAVEHAVRAVYARLVQANQAPDSRPLQRVLRQVTVPEFTMKAPGGSERRAAILSELHAGTHPWQRAKAESYTIQQLTVNGREATVLLTWRRVSDVKGQVIRGTAPAQWHHFVILTKGKDTWVKTPAGWKLKEREQLGPARMTRDGKPFP